MMMFALRQSLLQSLSLALFLSSSLPAQELVWERVGVKEAFSFGAGPVVTIGDINSDGYDDLVHIVLAYIDLKPGLDKEWQLLFLVGQGRKDAQGAPAPCPRA